MNVRVCVCARESKRGSGGGKKKSFVTLFSLVVYSSLNGATQIQEFPDLKGTSSLEIL